MPRRDLPSERIAMGAVGSALRFTRAYVKSMRIYFGFITGIAGLLGLSFYEFLNPGSLSFGRTTLILAALFSAYGVNQVINDYFGLKEDRVNAPNRPMVTGQLDPTVAILTSGALIAGLSVMSVFLNPWSIAPLIAGVALNLLYEAAKGRGLVGNLVFGMSIASCSFYGFMAAGPLPVPFVTPNRVASVTLVVLLNALMTYYTYFKDFEGDKAAGKRTFVVAHGLRAARYAGVVGAFLPTLAFFGFMYAEWMPWRDILHKSEFVYCGVMTLFLQLWTAVLFFRNPSGARTYFSLVTNIRACVAGQVTLIAVFNGTLALYLMSGSYILIGFLFDLHKDPKA